jgi:hypothetical protein
MKTLIMILAFVSVAFCNADSLRYYYCGKEIILLDSVGKVAYSSDWAKYVDLIPGAFLDHDSILFENPGILSCQTYFLNCGIIGDTLVINFEGNQKLKCKCLFEIKGKITELRKKPKYFKFNCEETMKMKPRNESKLFPKPKIIK